MKRTVLAASLFLSCMHAYNNTWAATDCFPDIGELPSSEAEEICSAKDKEWISGHPEGTFEPEKKINRAEASKILIKFNNKIEKPGNCFEDVKEGHWFSKFVCPLVKTPIIDGYDDGLFHPERNVTFAAASKLALTSIKYVKNHTPWYEPYIDLISKLDSKYFGNFNFDQEIKRKDFIHMLTLLEKYKGDDFKLYLEIMKIESPENDIGDPISEVECDKHNNKVNIINPKRRICSQRFDRGQLAIVYNNEYEIDCVVPFVPLFNEYLTKGQCRISPYDTEEYYEPKYLFQDKNCGLLCGEDATGCHVLSVGMIDYYYKNEKINGPDVNDYNAWLSNKKNRPLQIRGCELVLHEHKQNMRMSIRDGAVNGEITLTGTFNVLGENYIYEMERELDSIGKLKKYIKTRRPVLLQYSYYGSTSNEHAIVIVGKNSSGNYIVQDPYFNRINLRTTMFLTLEQAIENNKQGRDSTKITFNKLVFYCSDCN